MLDFEGSKLAKTCSIYKRKSLKRNNTFYWVKKWEGAGHGPSFFSPDSAVESLVTSFFQIYFTSITTAASMICNNKKSA